MHALFARLEGLFTVAPGQSYSGYVVGWGTLGLINARLGPGEGPQRTAVVPAIAAAGTYCYVLDRDLRPRKEAVRRLVAADLLLLRRLGKQDLTDQQQSSHDNGAVGHIEGRPVIRADVEIKEVHHVATDKTVP